MGCKKRLNQIVINRRQLNSLAKVKKPLCEKRYILYGSMLRLNLECEDIQKLTIAGINPLGAEPFLS